ncbi:Ig-like domain-containing protein [Listeria cornellensis]|uniref:Ig-like domain-containing protein n=1 Tax=Listeria cornellensis TaxID=1494961 RepID=UPI00131F2B9F|nr:Ig-like domain-containing protein [Listeria cornellensis]
MVKIEALASKIQANPILVNSDYAELKDDLLLAIEVLSEPTKSKLLEKYAVLLPKEVATSIEISTNQIQAEDGDKGQVKATVSPSKASQAVTYQSSNTDVITIDGSGNWKAIGAGEAIITVTSASNPGLTKKNYSSNHETNHTE